MSVSASVSDNLRNDRTDFDGTLHWQLMLYGVTYITFILEKKRTLGFHAKTIKPIK